MTKNNSWKKNVFNSLGEFENLVMEMPDAIEKRIHIEDSKPVNEFCEYREFSVNPDFYNEEFKAIVNKRTGEVAQIATDSYTVLQHRNYYSMLALNFEEIGVNNISGYILEKDGGNAINARVVFRDFVEDEPAVGKNIMLGAEFNNSFDKKFAATGNAYFYRLICSNGMILKKLIPGCDFSRNHNARSETEMLNSIQIRADGFIKGIVESGELFKDVMNDAIESRVVFENPVQLFSSMEEIFGSKKHAENIGQIARKSATVGADAHLYLNKWDLYNSSTDYASHNAMTPDVFSKILETAESKILDPKAKIPLPIPIPNRR